jgi:hypothetical protein
MWDTPPTRIHFSWDTQIRPHTDIHNRFLEEEQIYEETDLHKNMSNNLRGKIWVHSLILLNLFSRDGKETEFSDLNTMRPN